MLTLKRSESPMSEHVWFVNEDFLAHVDLAEIKSLIEEEHKNVQKSNVDK